MNYRLTVLLIFLLTSSLVHSQQLNLNQEQMQRLTQQAQQMQICMSRIDQQALIALSKKAQVVSNEIKSLCQTNQQDKALDIAIDFG